MPDYAIYRIQCLEDIPPKYLDKFWAKVDDTNDCWKWLGTKDKNGYGLMYVGHILGSGTTIRSNILSHLINIGPIPKGLFVCHTCKSKECCNPEHLELGTPRKNARDRVRDGTVLVGSNNPSSKLSVQDVKEICRLYFNEKYTQVKLGELFGVDYTTIGLITTGKHWSHITGLTYKKRRRKYAS